MNFKAKCSIQWALSFMPFSTHMNRFMQLYITKSLPISEVELSARASIVSRHIATYYAKRGKMPENVLDIGSGSDLSIPMLMTRDAKVVVASDIARLASNYLIKDIIARTSISEKENSKLSYIVYKPPKLPFNDNFFDLITSTSVLEHVPEVQMPILASEIYRLLKSDGISTHHIAHEDHWSHSDPTIHHMNYLRYEEKEWKLYNPPLMYQNRLLSEDFSKIFTETGFLIDSDKTIVSPPEFEIATRFQKYSTVDLSTTHTWLTLTKQDVYG